MNKNLKARLLNVLDEGYRIRFGSEYVVEGFAILLYNGQVGVVGKNTYYVVGPEHLRLLDKAGVPYEIVKD